MLLKEAGCLYSPSCLEVIFSEPMCRILHILDRLRLRYMAVLDRYSLRLCNVG